MRMGGMRFADLDGIVARAGGHFSVDFHEVFGPHAVSPQVRLGLEARKTVVKGLLVKVGEQLVEVAVDAWQPRLLDVQPRLQRCLPYALFLSRGSLP